jgi:3-hydroxyacyl-CoA dehydrogenase
MGVPQRSFSDEEILRRLLFASVNEACKILEEGKAYRASDIDVMWLNGFGFPRYRGGLMYWADGIGVAEVYRQIQQWHQQYGERASAASPKPAPRCAKPSRADERRRLEMWIKSRASSEARINSWT